jgi:hypothetical protein
MWRRPDEVAGLRERTVELDASISRTSERLARAARGGVERPSASGENEKGADVAQAPAELEVASTIGIVAVVGHFNLVAAEVAAHRRVAAGEGHAHAGADRRGLLGTPLRRVVQAAGCARR